MTPSIPWAGNLVLVDRPTLTAALRGPVTQPLMARLNTSGTKGQRRAKPPVCSTIRALRVSAKNTVAYSLQYEC